jgi:hypothetical protein
MVVFSMLVYDNNEIDWISVFSLWLVATLLVLFLIETGFHF